MGMEVENMWKGSLGGGVLMERERERERERRGRERYTACTLLGFHVTYLEGAVHLSYLSHAHYCSPAFVTISQFVMEPDIISLTLL
jgi:biotin transporter BioY